MILAITGLIRDFLQSTDRIMMGRKDVSMEASLHLNFGSNVESQGYPRMRSSPPRCHDTTDRGLTRLESFLD